MLHSFLYLLLKFYPGSGHIQLDIIVSILCDFKMLIWLIDSFIYWF